MRYFLEACCTSAADAVTAQRAGARRIELCSRLDIGGVTPSEDLIRSTLLALAEDALIATSPSVSLAGDAPSADPLPVNVLVRPRGGDFVYSEEEIQRTIAAIEMCKRLIVRDSSGKEHRVNGVVIGALRADGGIDVAAMRRLVAAARPLQVTFHRAFDECSDVERCLEDVIALGCERLLTSGHEPDAFAGRFTLARLVRQAAGRIVILAGCGVRPHNIAAIASAIAGLNPSAAITSAIEGLNPSAAITSATAGLNPSAAITGLSTSSVISGVTPSSVISGVTPSSAVCGPTPSSALAGGNPSATVKEIIFSNVLEFHSSTLSGW